MVRKEYSAGAVKFAFWFQEFRTEVELLSEGLDFSEIRTLSQEKNIFRTKTKARAEMIYSTVSARIRCLDAGFYPLFLHSDLDMQKLYCLAAAMAHDTLFFDFVDDVIRNRLLTGICSYTDADVRVFFRKIQMQDEKAAKWTEETLIRLGQTYRAALADAGITDRGREERRIFRILPDQETENWLRLHGLEPVLRALTGG